MRASTWAALPKSRARYSAAKSEADSILAKQPTHLLGLVLAMQVARSSGDTAGGERVSRAGCAPRKNPSSPRSFRSTSDTSPTSGTHSRAASRRTRAAVLIARSLIQSHAHQDDSRRAQPRLRRRVHVLRARRGKDRYGRASLRARAAGHRVAQPARPQGGARGDRRLDSRLRISRPSATRCCRTAHRWAIATGRGSSRARR